MKEIILGKNHPIPGLPIYRRTEAPPMEKWFRALLVLMPVYIDGNGNNSTLVVLQNGEMFYILLRTQSVKNHLLKHFYISQQDLRRACEQDIAVSLHTPLVFASEDRVYATLKVRKPISRNDGANGYFRLDVIAGAYATSRQTTRLQLENGISVEIDMPIDRVVSRTRAARNSLILFKSRGEPYVL